MKLIDMVKSYEKTLVAPLLGYPCVKLTNSTALDNLKDAQKQFDTINCMWKKFNPDIIIPFMDLSVEAESLGLKVEFHKNESPDVKQHPLGSSQQLKDYKVPNPNEDGRMKIFISTIKKLNENTNAIIGAYVASPFTLAGLMMGAENLAVNTMLEPEFCHDTLNFATQVTIEYAKAQQDAGADFIILLEPTAVLLSPSAFDEFVAPYINKVVDLLNVPVVLHVCGQTTNIVPNMCKTKIQGLSLDGVVNFPEISKLIPENIVLIGNIDPVDVMLNMSPENVYEETMKFLKSMENVPNFILSTGCDIPPATSMENISAFCRAANDFNIR